jgi:hypothetical protein
MKSYGIQSSMFSIVVWVLSTFMHQCECNVLHACVTDSRKGKLENTRPESLKNIRKHQTLLKVHFLTESYQSQQIYFTN